MNGFQLTSFSTKPTIVAKDVYCKDKQGNIKSWTVTEQYETCKIFLENEYDLPYADDLEFSIDPAIEKNFLLENRLSVFFEFDLSFSDREKEDIERNWFKQGSLWLENSIWLTDYESITMPGPFKVDLSETLSNTPITLSQRPKYNWS